MVWRPLEENKDDRFQNSITMSTEYLDARLELNDPKLTIRMSLGPAFKFHLIPMPKKYAPGLSLYVNLIITPQSRRYLLTLMTHFGSGISDPLAFGGHLQPFRMDHIFSVAGEDDPDGCTPGSVKYELVIMIGMDAYVMVFFQRVGDLSWIGTLRKSTIPSEMVRGLWYAKRVHHQCLNVHVDMAHFNEELNKWLHDLQEPLREAVGSIGEHVSKHANRPQGWENGVQSWHPDSNSDRELIDFLQWMHYLDKSDPGLKWKDCESHHPGCDDPNDPFLVADMSGDCPEDGMCDPWSTFYIPAGISEAENEQYDHWLHTLGENGTLAGLNYTGELGVLNDTLNYNSSTVAPPASTAFTPSGPTSMAYDPTIPKDWQDALVYNSSTVTLATATTTTASASS